MITFLGKIIEMVLPQRADAAVVARTESLSGTTQTVMLEGNDVHFLLTYRKPEVQAAIHEAKFHDNHYAHQLLAAVIKHYTETCQAAFELIVPLPLSTLRRKERGYNQVARVLDAAHIHYVDVLSRYDRTPQSHLKRTERLHNVENAFSVHKEYAELITGRSILLIDDVATTGATFAAARAVLLPYKPHSITCLALAH